MKSGIKPFYLALALIGAGAFSSAHAAPVPAKNEAVQPAAGKGVVKTSELKAGDAKTTDAGDGVVSINTASAEDLARAINGVGLKKAQAIVSYREEYGPFKELDQLQEVPGIGIALVERNRAHLKL